ncbi:MAG: hypothetical protein LBN39_04720 [Planctomycetaceae bacterium]|nr:hypothetical protein [Planctomycetaceae bacterium]
MSDLWQGRRTMVPVRLLFLSLLFTVLSSTFARKDLQAGDVRRTGGRLPEACR